MQRRLAAILVADIVGYSSLMEQAEEHTAERVARCQELVRDKVAALGGRVFNTAGDAYLAEFGSPINALRCAAEIRSALAGSEDTGGDPLRLRFGPHLADVVVRGDDLVGDGVNVAARLQQAAEPDSIFVSGAFFDNIRRNSPFAFDDLGERHLKNLSEPIRVYRLREEMARHRLQSAPTRDPTTGERWPLSLAVLPFRVMGGDEEQRFLAEGLADELIVELARFRRLFVSSRSASFALADANPVKVGATLGVRYVLEGQVRRIGDEVRIALTLIETESGSVVWSDKIARPFSEVLDLLDATAARIAATVFGRVEDAGMITARRKLPENMSAFECLLRGIEHHRLGGVLEEHSREARQLLLPFVDRLACADTPEVERAREIYISTRLRWRQTFRERLATLEGALTIGRRADAPAPEEVRARLEGVQQRAALPTSRNEHPLLTTVQGWLTGVF